ncbi:MAG: tetratricopeptide repeat protein [Pseudobdellovibrio sp.]
MAPQVSTISPVYLMKTDMYPNSISRADYYEQMGNGYVEIRQYDKAIESYKISILHNPNSSSSLIALADAYVATKRYLLAQIALQDAMKAEPQNSEITKKLGDLYLEAHLYSKAREVYEQLLKSKNHEEDAQWAIYYIYKLERKYNEALNVVAQIPQREVNRAKLAYEKAILYKAKHEFADYNFYLKEAIKYGPRDRDILLEFARNSYDNRNYKDAASALLNYSNTHSYDEQISQHLAFASVQAGVYEVAIREYEKQKTTSNDPMALDLKIAHCYYLMDDLSGAEKRYLKLAVEYQSDEARYYLGQIYLQKNDFDNSLFVLQQIPPVSDFYADAQVKMALYYKTKGEDDKSLNLLREAFVQRPDQLEVYQAYGDFLIEHKRYVETVALLERAIQLFPNDEEVRLKMAYLHFRLNNQKSFKKQIKAALKINPQSADAYAMLAELWYMKNRDVDETMFFINKATELHSKNKNIKPILAWVLMQKNRSTEAVAIFEEFYEENPTESFFARSLSQVYSRGGIKDKAEKLSDLAVKLEADDSLKSRFIFKDSTEKVDTDELLENKTRLPASLENQ